MARPARDRLDEYPKHRDVDKVLGELKQLSRDLKIAKAYEKSLRQKQYDKILAIRAKRKPDGAVVQLDELAAASNLSYQRIAQICSGYDGRRPKRTKPVEAAEAAADE